MPISPVDYRVSINQNPVVAATIWITTLAYIPVVRYIQYVFRERAPWGHSTPVFVWNASLSILSLTGSMGILFSQPEILTRRLVPSPEYSEVTRLVISIFCLTKFTEYGDTIFLALKKRPTIFLHLYHHVTVTLYCWHAVACEVPFAHMFAWINLNVHAIMYGYYAATCKSKHKILVMLRPYITMIQLLQMVVGMFLSFLAVTDNYEYRNWRFNATLALAMYISYAYLFASFFIRNYTGYNDITILFAGTPPAVLAVAVLTRCYAIVGGYIYTLTLYPMFIYYSLAHLESAPVWMKPMAYHSSLTAEALHRQPDMVMGQVNVPIVFASTKHDRASLLMNLAYAYTPIPLVALILRSFLGLHYTTLALVICSTWTLQAHQAGGFRLVGKVTQWQQALTPLAEVALELKEAVGSGQALVQSMFDKIQSPLRAKRVQSNAPSPKVHAVTSADQGVELCEKENRPES